MMPGDDLVRNCRTQRFENRVNNGHRKSHPPAHWGRAGRTNHLTRRHDHIQRAKTSIIYRVFGRAGQALVGDLCTRNPSGYSRVVEPGHLIAYFGQVNCHASVRHHHPHFDWHWCSDVQAVIVHERLRFISSLRNLRNRLSSSDIRLIHDDPYRCHHWILAIAFYKFNESAFAGGHCGILCAQVAHCKLG
ncbi:unannotated protein [freshwater metagenome]|uniref:Unannotated protein n=1 Tax=freshwater metagenome TaxID=449393 RepID=A0A6J5Z4Q2_9ZZZZ